jgi:hypothetical protein
MSHALEPVARLPGGGVSSPFTSFKGNRPTKRHTRAQGGRKVKAKSKGKKLRQNLSLRFRALVTNLRRSEKGKVTCVTWLKGNHVGTCPKTKPFWEGLATACCAQRNPSTKASTRPHGGGIVFPFTSFQGMQLQLDNSQ